MRQQLQEAIEQAGDHPVTLLTATGSVFCAGLDLKEPGDPKAASTEFLDLVESIYRSKSIFIAVLQGAALGGGMTLTNACDLAVATPNTSFSMPEIKAGIYPGLVGPSTQLIIPKKVAAWMALTGDHLPVEEALNLGIINQIFDPECILEEAQSLATRISEYSSVALKESKKALNEFPVNENTRRKGAEMGTTINEYLFNLKR